MEEVYGIRTFGRHDSLKQSYHSFYRIYPDSITENIKTEKILEVYLKDNMKDAILGQTKKLELK